jgi:hypothetical protein
MATIDEKTGGVRSGGSDDAPTWHTLETLKALDLSAQLDLAQGLVAQCKHSNETAGEFEVRAKLRWRKNTVRMLCDAETHWRAQAIGRSAKKVKFRHSVSITKLFLAWSAAFFGRVHTHRIDAAIATAKSDEGDDAPEPAPDGLGDAAAQGLSTKRQKLLATKALAALHDSTPSRYRTLCALRRCGSPEALQAALSADTTRAYKSLLIAVLLQEEVQDEESALTCGRAGCKENSDATLSLESGDGTEALPLCKGCHQEAVRDLGKHKRKNPQHPRWTAMCRFWVTQNPKQAAVECWSCDENADKVQVQEERH